MILDFENPETFEQFIGTHVDWNFTSVPQVNAGNRQLASPRGKLLGGTGIVNGIFFVKYGCYAHLLNYC